MIQLMSDSNLEIRSSFLYEVRRIFYNNSYMEIETPLLNPGGNVEAFIDPIEVKRTGIKKSPEDKGINRGRYLITSPEYNLKSQFVHSKRNLFQIAHCFREGDVGRLHTEEFLMLEWYRRDCTLEGFMEECRELLFALSNLPFVKNRFLLTDITVLSVEELFRKNLNCGLEFDDLCQYGEKQGYLRLQDKSIQPRYDEIFYIIFLNEIEKHLGNNAPCFIYNYPPELAALSKIENGRARRFEIYWKGVEMANGYEELRGRDENLNRFQKENQLRLQQNKNTIVFEEQYLECMDELPQSCGIALGLDRLLMVLLNESSIHEITPFI